MMSGLIAQVTSYCGMVFEFTELLSNTQMFVQAACIPMCLISHSCGHGSD